LETVEVEYLLETCVVSVVRHLTSFGVIRVEV